MPATWHWSSAVQTTGLLPVQTPLWQVSLRVQAAPSSQGVVLLVCVPAVAWVQPSVVHTLPALQFAAAPPTQLPPEHVSPVVQALPSSQGFVLLVWVQPVAGVQPSVVHTLPSSQLG